MLSTWFREGGVKWQIGRDLMLSEKLLWTWIEDRAMTKVGRHEVPKWNWFGVELKVASENQNPHLRKQCRHGIPISNLFGTTRKSFGKGVGVAEKSPWRILTDPLKEVVVNTSFEIWNKSKTRSKSPLEISVTKGGNFGNKFYTRFRFLSGFNSFWNHRSR